MFKHLFTNTDGTPNWLGCVATLVAAVIVPGLLVARLTHHPLAGIITSAVILVAVVAALFVTASALKGLS